MNKLNKPFTGTDWRPDYTSTYRDSRNAFGYRYQADEEKSHDWLYLAGAIAVILFAAWMRFL